MSIRLRLRGFANRKDGFFILLVGITLILVVIAQQLLPSGKPIPFARVDGSLVHISSAEDIIRRYRVTEERELTLKIDDFSATYKLKDLGVSLDEQPTIQPYIVESRLKRLIPFSTISQMYRDNLPSYTSSKKSLYIVTTAIADQINVLPKNAEILTDTSTPQIKSSVNGINFEPDKATIAILDAISNNQEEVVLKKELIEPTITTSELELATKLFTATLPHELTVNIGDQKKTLASSTMYSWLSYQIKNDKPEVNFDDQKIQAFAEELTNEFASSQMPTATLVNLQDGIEIGRINGQSGKSIDATTLKNEINNAIKTGQNEIVAKLVDVPSPIKYTRSYTRSSAGLQDLLDQITADKEISIRFVDINDRKWSVGSREHTKSNMASTYKMFVTYSVLKRIDEGSMSFTDQVNGQTIDSCLQKIIIDSNNECSIALAERIGWLKIADEGRAIGAMDLDWKKDLTGSVYDASIVPIKLARGEILTESSRNYMLDLMKRQRFRNGIPAGTTSVVADKVGFIDGWLNDAGIVYAPDMTYVLAIYTKGQSWATIAEITRQIESLAL